MFTQRIILTSQDAKVVSLTKLHELGSVAETADGRVYRYSRSGAVNLLAGKVTVSSSRITNHQNIPVALAANLNSRSVSVTVGGTATTVGQYDDGCLVVNDGPGVGNAYRIAGTPAISASATGVIQLNESIAIALTTSSLVTLQPNLWADTTLAATSSANCDGMPNVPVAAASYYWSQTAGIASVLSDGIIAKGVGAVVSTSVNGALTTEAAGTITQRVATAVEATVDTKYYPMVLGLE